MWVSQYASALLGDCILIRFYFILSSHAINTFSSLLSYFFVFMNRRGYSSYKWFTQFILSDCGPDGYISGEWQETWSRRRQRKAESSLIPAEPRHRTAAQHGLTVATTALLGKVSNFKQNYQGDTEQVIFPEFYTPIPAKLNANCKPRFKYYIIWRLFWEFCECRASHQAARRGEAGRSHATSLVASGDQHSCC